MPTGDPWTGLVSRVAGAYDALRDPLQKLPASFGTAVSIAHHQCASADCRLIEVFRRRTQMPVRIAEDSAVGAKQVKRAGGLVVAQTDALLRKVVST